MACTGTAESFVSPYFFRARMAFWLGLLYTAEANMIGDRKLRCGKERPEQP